MKNTFEQKKIPSVFKYFIMIALVILIFGTTSTIAYACHCSGGVWACDPTLKCASEACVIGCSGHTWSGHYNEKINSRTVTRTCSRDGYSQDQYLKYDYCTQGTCGQNKYQINKDTSWGGAYNYQSHTGCNFTSWYDNGSNSKHYKHCQNGHHDEGVDGSKYNSASHSLGGKHQGSNGGDWKWHKDCTVYNCYRKDVDWGWNTGYVTFHYGNGQGSTGKSAAANSTITSPGSLIAAGKTLVGWNSRSSTPTEYHVQQVPGASLIAGKYNWSTGTAKAVTELVPSAKNNETGYDNAAGVWEYNYIRVHYRSGYGDGLSNDTCVDYVDYAQSLTSRKITQFSRTGYDIITKGWFIGRTNENSFTHHINKSADAVCGDTAQYAFNKNYSAQQWSSNVVNNHITDIYLYPHWRAHVLTIKYNVNGGNGSIPSAVWYYDDGASGTTQKTYYVSNSVPTRAGYVFMGWGNSNKWCKERYASQSANDGSGYKIAYDGTQAKRQAKTAQDWASYFGVRSTFDKQDTSITFYAQWERIIAYKFFYYNDNNNKAYNLDGGFQDYNTATVAFHNDDNEYLWMDIYMHDTDSKAAGNITKDFEEIVSFNHSSDWASRGFKLGTSNRTAEIDIGTLDSTKILDLHKDYDKQYFKSSTSEYTKDGNHYKFWNKKTGTHNANEISNDSQPDSFLCSSIYPTRYIKIYPGYAQTANYYMSYERVVKVEYHDYAEDTKHNGEAHNASHVNRLTSYMNSSASATTPQFTTHTECTMKYTESAADGKGKKETWTSMGWASSILNDNLAKSAYKTYSCTDYGKQKVAAGSVEPKFIDQNTKFKTNRDIHFYGLYYKDVKITYDLNGGNGIRAKRHSRSVGKPIGFIFLPFFIINIVLIIYFLTPSVYVFARNPTLPPRFQTGHTVLV